MEFQKILGLEAGLMRIKKIAFNLKHLALNYGLLGGNSNYRRFIILGEARSGSNFLRGLLNSHPHVVVFGEIFRFFDNIGWELPDYESYRQTQQLISLMQRDPVAFLESRVFETFPSSITAVGFKLFYYHAQEDSRRIIWQHLRSTTNIYIIHLKRRNSLRALLSRKKAHITNKWANHRAPEKDTLSIEITTEECLEQFTWSREMWTEYDRFFVDHPKMDLFYEDLEMDFEKGTHRALAFLGVSPRRLSPNTYKQASQPLSEAISNYALLKKHFKETEWGLFFEE